MNQGLLALAKGDKTAAETYLGKAAGAKNKSMKHLVTLYVAQGQYDRAVNALATAKQTVLLWHKSC